MKNLIAAAAAASLLAGTALAQTGKPSTTTAPGTTPATQAQPANTGDGKAVMPKADMNKGIAMATSANEEVRFVAPRSADMMVSKLIGLDVYNNKNEEVGEIEDIAIQNGTTLSGVVVSVGGFLGLGERYVLIDPATIVVDKQGNTWKAFVDTSKDKLKNAPEFKYSKVES